MISILVTNKLTLNPMIFCTFCFTVHCLFFCPYPAFYLHLPGILTLFTGTVAVGQGVVALCDGINNLVPPLLLDTGNSLMPLGHRSMDA